MDAPLPADELTIGGIQHRFMLEALTAEQIAGLAESGVGGFVECPPRETSRNAAAAAGVPYFGLPATGDKASEILRAAVKEADAEARTLVFICGDGTALGAAWARYRVAADGAAADVALAEARVMQTLDPIEAARLELDLVQASAISGD